ncbi:MAG: CPBP family glutamic-type intramembrane protease [Bacteroidota bacterium]
MEEIMQSNSFFILPLTVSYLAICGLWFLLNKYRKSWQIVFIDTSKKPWVDLILGIVAAVAILAIGQLYSAGYLIPRIDNELLNRLTWPLNNILIFSPIFIVLILRKQNLKTVFISKRDLPIKLTFGLASSFIGIVLFTALRGEWNRIPEILNHAIQAETLSNFPAIFFENMAVAFLFVRLKWVVGIKWAISIPALLFALAHVPGSLAEGDPWSHILTFFFLTGSLTTVILYTAYRSRDIIWLGVVHYFMDVVIKAF